MSPLVYCFTQSMYAGRVPSIAHAAKKFSIGQFSGIENGELR
jgi:hypothetical protein